VNHIAFGAHSLDDLEARKDRWLGHGHDVVRIDHGWCVSIYANDPSGTMVEFCVTTRALTEEDARVGLRTALEAAPEINREEPTIDFFEAKSPAHA